MSRAKAHLPHIEEDRAERLRQTGRAIRHARGELTQSELGERLGPYLGEAVPQTTISRWESGSVTLDVEVVHALELALDLDPGTLFHNAGYVPLELDATDGEALLHVDPNIDDSLRDTAVSQYRVWVNLSKEIRKTRKPRPRR
jgi:transcriptional regulator with XRE-family HTH domain